MYLAEDDDFLVQVPEEGVRVVDEVPQNLRVVGGGHDHGLLGPVVEYQLVGKLAVLQGPWLLQLAWTSVIWRTLMVCSVFCSLKAYLHTLGLRTMSFLPACPSNNARRTSLEKHVRAKVTVPSLGGLRRIYLPRTSVNKDDSPVRP